MCDHQSKEIRESQIRKEAASKAIIKTLAMVSDALAVSVPNIGTPSENREAFVEILRRLALGA